MTRKWGLGLAALLFLLVQTASAEDFPICSANPPRLTVAQQLLSKLRQLAQYGPIDKLWPGATNPLPPYLVPHERPASAPTGPCVDKEKRFGYFGFDHCRLHPYYQQVFPQAGCNCYTGQCRPTDWRPAKVTPENPSGVEIYISGGWYPLPLEVLHKFYKDGPRKLPDPLLEYDAHVCASEPTATAPPTIECGWIRDPS